MIVALSLAFRGSGAWALVWAEVASVSVETLAYWLISPWRPKLSFSRKIARQDLGFGWVVLGGSVLIFAFRSIDRVVLSRAMATYYLGLYAFAYSIANIPAFLLTRVLNTVLLPSYSALSEDRDRQRELFYRATSYLAGTGSIYMLCLLAFGGYGLSSLYGDKWADAVLPLSVLSVFGLARALTDLCGDLLIGTGHPGQFRRVQAVQLAVALVAIYPGVLLWGVTGVAVAMTLAAVAALVIAERMSGSILAGTASDLASAFRGPLIAFAVLVIPAFGLERVLPDGGSLPAVVAASFAVAVSYLGVWLAVDRHLRRDIADWRRGSGPGTGGTGGAS
jgi:O-antigen/teichoic acid export membrane protein